MYDIFLAFDGGSSLEAKLGKTGTAIYDASDSTIVESSRLYSEVTNNYCELKSLAEGLDVLAAAKRKEGNKKLKLLLIGDSQYVLKSFSEWAIGWARAGQHETWFSSKGPLLNQELIKYIYYNYITETDSYEFSYLHVKGHLDYNNDVHVNKMMKHFQKQGYNFDFKTTRFIIQLNNRADELSSCMKINEIRNMDNHILTKNEFVFK